ncbi:ImmA/IrrE family metallo-endopeptidase [Lacinutrix himadriensis]|uniref:ImmA/IrrE family metallo-endopeptidase n=1 Tax=Lacinutrix himadriensis TaxID=641549 RepID=UPI0006E46B13|nr:hypothetical protein [Lacinutrix himadriensis]
MKIWFSNNYLFFFIFLLISTLSFCQEPINNECGFIGFLDESEYLEVEDIDSLFVLVFNKAADIANVRDKNILFKKFKGKSKKTLARPMAIAKISPEIPQKGIREQIRVRYSEEYFKEYFNKYSANKFLMFDSGEDFFFNWSKNDEDFFNLLFVIFHELGHFLGSDNLKIRNCKENSNILVESELQADFFAAEQLYKLDITPAYNVFKVFDDFKSESNQSCYPNIEDRIKMTIKGFEYARKKQITTISYGVRELINSTYVQTVHDENIGFSDGTILINSAYNETDSGTHVIYENQKTTKKLYGIKHNKIVILKDNLNGIQLDNLKTQLLPLKYGDYKPVGLSSRNDKVGVNQIYGINKKSMIDTVEIEFKKVRFDSVTTIMLKNISKLNIDRNIIDDIKELTKDFLITEHFSSDGLHINDAEQDLYEDTFLDEFGNHREGVTKNTDEHLRTFGKGKYEILKEGSVIIKREYERYELVFDSKYLDKEYIEYGFSLPRDLDCFKYFKSLNGNDAHSVFEGENGKLYLEKRNLDFQPIIINDDGSVTETGNENSGNYIIPFTINIEPCLKY